MALTFCVAFRVVGHVNSKSYRIFFIQVSVDTDYQCQYRNGSSSAVTNLEKCALYPCLQKNYSGFVHLGAGLCVGLTGLAAGYAIGIVGDVVRATSLSSFGSCV